MSKLDQLDNPAMKNLYNAILSLENQDECREDRQSPEQAHADDIPEPRFR